MFQIMQVNQLDANGTFISSFSFRSIWRALSNASWLSFDPLQPISSFDSLIILVLSLQEKNYSTFKITYSYSKYKM